VSEYDVAVVGGGCVGLSVAYHLAGDGLAVAVLEKEYHLAAHQSGRNSGVLHPGFNYPPGSRKAHFATEGTRRTKAFCEEHGVPLDELGVVVAAQDDDEEARLGDLADNADANGVAVELLDEEGLREREPHAAGQAALHCPEAASVDSQAYVYALGTAARDAGVDLLLGYRVEGASRTASGLRVHTDKGDVTADYLVNAAGLHADRLAAELGVGDGARIVPFRGEYYELRPGRRDLCRTMIYPAPDPELPFLGVHFTRRADGKVIVGPNAVLAFGREAYRNTDFDLGDLAETLSYGGFWRLVASRKMLGVARQELAKSYRKARFVAASQRLVPDVRGADLARSYAGIRAQLVSPNGDLVKDPVFETGPRSLHVLNAVSPGLTSSLPLGEHLAGRVDEAL